jgi:hypothetical protein
MKHFEYKKVCEEAFSGEELVVENRGLHEKGKVYTCDAESFNVLVKGEWRLWSRQICETVPGTEKKGSSFAKEESSPF